MKKLISIVVSAVLIFSLFAAAVPSTAAANSAPSPAARRLGCWWWHKSDATNIETRDAYLDFLQQAGVNEIYFYAYSDLANQRFDDIHTFISAAMAHGMRVAILFDDPDAALDPDFTYLTRLKNGFLAYKAQYPDDALYGLHFDVEPGHTTAALESYCYNFVPKMAELRSAGICCEPDVACGWASKGADFTLNGITGIYNIIAANCDTMTLMSYRDTAQGILNFGNTAYNSCLEYGCDVVFGAETGNSGEGDSVDFYDETKEYLMGEVDAVFDTLEQRAPSVGYGMAIHHVRSFYNLAGDLPAQDEPQSEIFVFKLGQNGVYAVNAGAMLDMDAPPMFVDSKTLVSVRYTSMALGTNDLVYDANDTSVTFTGAGGYTMRMVIGSGVCTATLDGVSFDLAITPPAYINGRVMLPIRDMSILVDGQIQYDDSGYVVVSTSAFDTGEIPGYIAQYEAA